ncbi:MAG: trigger factor [Lachnospiraceae bacterium]|nr:trigger factor [Lachnospiraceae bacterium]
MKKFLAIVLCAALCFSLAACSKSENSGDGTESTTSAPLKTSVEEGVNLITGYKTGSVTLGQYTGLTYKPLSTEVTDEEVQQELEDYLYSYKSKVEVTDRDTVQTGDVVDIDYEGLKDGVAFDGGTGNTSALQIGSGKFIPGFEDALIGHKKGTSFSIDVTFPENYKNTDLAGQPAVFNITLNGIYTYIIPEATDEFIAEKTTNKYTTVEAYKENIRNQKKEEKEEDAAIQKEYDLIQKLIDVTTYNIDMESEIQRGYESLIEYNNSMTMATYGMDAAGFYYSYYGVPLDQYEQLMRNQAEFSVKYEFARSAIVEAENFTVTDDEITELANKQMTQYGYSTLDEFYTALESANGVEAKLFLTEQVKLNKATDLILSTAIPE